MSALGNYVHYHKANYHKWGINQMNTSPSETWDAAAASFKESLNIASEMQSLMAEAQALEKQYNDLFYPPQGTAIENAKIFKEAMENAIQDKLNEEFGMLAGSFNSDNLTVDSNALYAELSKAISITRERIGIVEIQKRTTARQLLNQVNMMYNILDQEEFKSIAEAQSRLSEAKGQLSTIRENIQIEINRGSGRNIAIKNLANDIESLSEIIKEFNRVPVLTNQNGAVFEWILPFIKFQNVAIGKEALAKEMHSLASSGVILGDVIITVDTPDLEDNDLTDVDITSNNIKIKTFSTRSKTDVMIEYIDSNGDLQTKAVSAKNMKKNHVKLVSDTSLYRVLTLSGSYNFATHYLNVVTAADGQNSSREQILEANHLIKGLTLKLAAEGYDTTNSAELLIVNNYSERHIYVYNLKVLIYLIQDAIINQGKYSSAVNMSDSYTINQNFDKDSKEKRILNVIRSTQSTKITVNLNESMLNSYLTLLQ